MRKPLRVAGMRTKAPLILLAFFSALILCPPFARAFQASNQPEELQNLAAAFAPLDPALDLYEIPGEPDYALRAIFCSDRHLCEIGVVPRYFFSQYHPDWTEPDSTPTLSPTNYQAILDEIEKVKPLGSLEVRSRVALMLNLKLNFKETYENAILERVTFPHSQERHSSQPGYRIASFSVHYFHIVSGRIERKTFDEFDQMYTVRIGSDIFWVKKSDFEHSKKGSQVTIEAAGPFGHL